jgi:hypothetical protein
MPRAGVPPIIRMILRSARGREGEPKLVASIRQSNEGRSKLVARGAVKLLARDEAQQI